MGYGHSQGGVGCQTFEQFVERLPMPSGKENDAGFRRPDYPVVLRQKPLPGAVNRPVHALGVGIKSVDEDRVEDFHQDVRRIRRSASKLLWRREDYRQAVSAGVRNSLRNPEVRRKRVEGIKKKATAAALKRWQDPKYRQTMRWMQIQNWQRADPECKARMTNLPNRSYEG